jgi:hypothetical protein
MAQSPHAAIRAAGLGDPVPSLVGAAIVHENEFDLTRLISKSAENLTGQGRHIRPFVAEGHDD